MSMDNARLGIFLCRCGNNIADFVDLDELRQWAGRKSEVAFVETHDLLCSPAGRKFVEDRMKQGKVGTLIVAACSPKTHEKTFIDAAEKAGINRGRVLMANIREQCGWVTPDKNKATEKAAALIEALVRRSRVQETLEARSMECNTDLVVIGGGIAGIEAALAAAEAGRKVTLIEREISLGGALIKTEEIAPAMECAPCLLAPRLGAVRENKNIRVVSNAEVTAVLGFFGNFKVRVTRKARYIKDSCIGCEACFEACPVSVKSAFHLGLGTHKAVYTAFPGSVPAAAAIDASACRHFTDGSCDACVKACPFQAVDFYDKDEKLEFEAGAVIAAAGSESPVPVDAERYGLGRLDNVITLAEFERLASSNGPTGGEVRLKNGGAPGIVAVIHCAGSLTPKGLPYCSGICCMLAAKAGDLLRKKAAGTRIFNLHNRLVFDGPVAGEFYRRQVHEGTAFVRVDDLSSIRVRNQDNRLLVTASGMDPLMADLVVLATGFAPVAGSRELAALLNVERDAYGFFKPDHPVLNAMGLSLDGIYSAGSCASPCNAGDAVVRARAAAGSVLSRLVPGRRIELESCTSVIDETLCSGCKLCIASCPYQAVAFDAAKKVSVINEALCRGCGTCVAGCPGGASKARHFTDRQINAEIDGVLHG